MRFYFLKIEGEHLLNANWPVQTAINTDRTVCNAIQPTPIGPYRPQSSLRALAHFAEKDTLKRGELDDQANPTFPQEHGVDKYGREPYKW
jgi:hypothetical protein